MPAASSSWRTAVVVLILFPLLLVNACSLERLGGYSSGGPVESRQPTEVGDGGAHAVNGDSSTKSDDAGNSNNSTWPARTCPDVPATFPGQQCEDVCTGGCDGGVCRIVCESGSCNSATLTCPSNMACTITCGANACKAARIKCPSFASCSLTCAQGACAGAEVTCGMGSCSGQCNATKVNVECGLSCSCAFNTCNGS